ncbi:MAG: hypothetical protein JSR85_03245 [Proteobacteria bacterium]|nr:hypothetical protein [Pseudomonadota bacterium]
MPKVESVFYPFGGPDLLHPLILFPDAKTYVLVGLEAAGEALSQQTQDATFEKLDSLLRRGFFVTSSMSKSFNQKSGVRAALALQILLMDGKILEDSMIDPNTVSLTFEWNGQKKTAYYLKRNLIDNEDSLFAFLSAHGVSDVCMIKSSSYSLHNKVFSHLKDRILKSFPVLVQDDTGVPYKDLASYDVQLFGHYSTPYGAEFQCYQQNDLKTQYETIAAIPPLNFCFGYGCGRVQTNIMIARRLNEGN